MDTKGDAVIAYDSSEGTSFDVILARVDAQGKVTRQAVLKSSASPVWVTYGKAK